MLRSSLCRTWFAVAIGAVCLHLTAPLGGRYVQREIKKVPVERLAENIERQLAATPDDVQLRLNLARLYAMAYALKTVEFDATGESEPFFGHVPPAMTD